MLPRYKKRRRRAPSTSFCRLWRMITHRSRISRKQIERSEESSNRFHFSGPLRRWRGETTGPMHLRRDAARLSNEGARAVEVILTRRKQTLPLDVEVIPMWPNRDGHGVQWKRDKRLRFRNRHEGGRTAVDHHEHPADRHRYCV